MQNFFRRQIFWLTLGLALAATHLFASDESDWRDKMQVIMPKNYLCHYATNLIVIDGKLDEPDWQAAAWTDDFVDIEGDAKPKPRFRTRAKMLWDENFLYIAAELQEPHVWATLTNHDAVIFRDPDFEVFIDPRGETQPYYEFEMNALNTTWDLLLNKPYMDGGQPHNDWESGAKSAVQICGTLNNPADTDEGWTVEIAFPWRILSEHARHAGAPDEGEQWRINFSRVEWQITHTNNAYQKIPRTPEDNWVWSPQGVIDMHRPEMWGIVQFTRLPENEKVSVAEIPGKSARDLALQIYYAQRDFKKANERYATNLSELNLDSNPLPANVEKPALKKTDDGYVVEVAFQDDGQTNYWHIRQDRKLWLNE